MSAYPRATANMNPPFTTQIANRMPRIVTVRSGCRVASGLSMTTNVATAEPVGHDRLHVQHGAFCPRKCTTIAQEEALDELRTVSEPLTPSRVARVLGWSERTARRWIEEFQARGYLTASRDGRRWTAEGRAA